MPEPTQEFGDLSTFSNTLPTRFQSRIPVSDGWGRPFQVRMLRGEFVVLSTGENVTIDEPKSLNRLLSEQRGILQGLGSLHGDDLILVGSTGLRIPKSSDVKQKETMADMRSVATAIEMYAIDHSEYPGPTESFTNASFLISYLEGNQYIRTLPLRDAWGYPLLYWSNGTNYCVISTGQDGSVDADYIDSQVPDSLAGAFASYSGDIIFSDGQFARWPAGTIGE